MRKGLNVIQIKGMKGIVLAIFVVCCLATGFILFPAWLCMQIWNFTSSYVEQLPAIGIFQGVLLWGIIVSSYFTFRKEKVLVCMKTPEGLSEDEMKAVFANIKRQAQEDALLSTMLKAKEAELRIRNLSSTDIPRIDNIKTEESNNNAKSK